MSAFKLRLKFGVLLLGFTLCLSLIGCGGGGSSAGSVTKAISPLVRKQDGGTTPYTTYHTWIHNQYGFEIAGFDSDHRPTSDEIMFKYPNLFNTSDPFSRARSAATDRIVGDVAQEEYTYLYWPSND